MKATYKIEYTQEEITNFISMLKFLCTYDNDMDADGERTIPPSVCKSVDKAFEGLAELLCLDPNGEKEYNREGW